jgi:site-specific recombinase XerD
MTIFDPDLDKGCVRVMGKGSKERVVPMGRQSVLWVRQYLQSSRPRLLKERIDVHALWIGHDGTPLHTSRLEMIFGKYRAEAGVETNVTPHAVRRACATHMLRNGAHPVQVQMLLGHATLNTLSQYLQVTIRDLKSMHEQSKVGR